MIMTPARLCAPRLVAGLAGVVDDGSRFGSGFRTHEQTCVSVLAAPAKLLARDTTVGALASCVSAHSKRSLNRSSFCSGHQIVAATPLLEVRLVCQPLWEHMFAEY